MACMVGHTMCLHTHAARLGSRKEYLQFLFLCFLCTWHAGGKRAGRVAVLRDAFGSFDQAPRPLDKVSFLNTSQMGWNAWCSCIRGCTTLLLPLQPVQHVQKAF